MDQSGHVSTWRQRLLFDEGELSRVEEHACVLEQATADAERALTAARMHFETLSNQVDEINERRHLLRESTTQLRAQLATRAFRRLPLEILQAVFLELAQEEDPLWPAFSTGTYNYKRARIPFLLAGVSRGWRNLALATPELWSCISVPPTNVLRAGSFVTTLLIRSGRSPIDILFPWGQSITAPWTDQSGEGQLLDYIGAHTSRWRRFELHLPNGALDVETLGILRRPTPLLEEFIVSSSEGDQNLALFTFPHFLPFAPRLRFLFSKNCNIVPSPGAVVMEQMQSLRLFAVMTCRSFWELLRLTPNLGKLSVRLNGHISDADFRITSRLEFPHLHALFLFSDTCITFANNAQQLALPSLRSIYVLARHVQALADLWRQVNRTLSSLLIDYERVDVRHVESLRPLGRLRQLSFGHCVVETVFLDALSEEQGGTWVLPMLQYIEFLVDSKLERDSPESLTRLVRARHAAHRRGLPDSPRRLCSVKFNQSAISPWVVEQVTLVLEELQ